jgi:geranylgeranyl pyrophosphate synthase
MTLPLVPSIFRRPQLAEPLGLAEFKVKLDVVLDELFAKKVESAREIDVEYAELLIQMHDFIIRGGKRLRPYLAYLSYLGYGGKDEESILHVAAALELYHNAWLIHDDIIDRDIIRYGGANVSGTYLERFGAQFSTSEARHLGDSMALIAGDVNIIVAAEQIMTSRFSDSLKLNVLARAQKLNFELAGGELLDVLMPTFPLEAVTADRLLKVCQYKTASYTFEAPLQIGAILAGRDASSVAGISSVAIPMGIAFQLADDLLGTFGNESELGKPVLTDLREGKRTLLVLFALEHADETQKAVLNSSLGNPKAGYRHLEQVRKIMEDTGARTYVEQMAQTKMELALTKLDSLQLSKSVTEELRRLGDFSLRRRS